VSSRAVRVRLPRGWSGFASHLDLPPAPEVTRVKQGDMGEMGDESRSQLVARLQERLAALEEELAQQRAQAIDSFTFSDEGSKCKICVQLGSGVLGQKVTTDDPGVMHLDAAATVAFTETACEVHIYVPSPSGGVAAHHAVTFLCEAEVVPSKCTFRVDRPSGCVVILLKKKDEERAWSGVTTQQVAAGQASSGELALTVHIDRGIGLQVRKMVARGTSVWALKQQLARDDPTGSMKPRELSLAVSGTGGVLADTAVLDGSFTELEVCAADVLSQPD